MKVAYCSDLHIEFGDIDLKNTENVDVLVIAGDTVLVELLHKNPPTSEEPTKDWYQSKHLAYRFRKFFERINKEFPKTLIILGNHEFYNGRWVESIDHFREEIDRHENITLLERESVDIGNVTFIGCTLWTDMNRSDPITLYSIRYGMNDFKLIRHDAKGYSRLAPADTVIRHRTSLDFIANTAKKDGREYVVIGHHSPSRLSTHPKFKDDHEMNGGYSSSLTQFIYDHPQIKFWIHGHTHFPFDYVVGETRILCNPRGYHEVEETAANFELKYFEVG